MSYQLGYELQNELKVNQTSFKCMSYQLGYELALAILNIR